MSHSLNELTEAGLLFIELSENNFGEIFHQKYFHTYLIPKCLQNGIYFAQTQCINSLWPSDAI